MSDKNNEAFANFVAITGASEERANFFMESSNWDLDVALLNFYELKDGETSEESSSREDRPTVSQPSSNSAPKKPEKKSVIKSTGNVRTLSNLKPDPDSGESSEEEEGQAFYAGGSEHSGQQVLGPPRGRRADIVSDMFRSVRAFGAEVVEPQSSSSRSRQPIVFGGTGYRLGETSDDSQAVAAKKTDDNSLFEITLKFWKNGFSVNDGPLRSYEDPKSQEILHHIKHGEIPNELIMQAEGREISFNLEDFRHSEYVGSSPKSASFTGTGQKLGSVTPTLSSPSPASDNSSSREDAAVQPNPVEVDNSRPTTNIQIRLADGSRLVGTFNHDHTINDIRRYINASSASSRDRGYILLSSFPRKELVNNEETIAQAGLVNSVVMQHLVA
ncbi:hypothetical protein V9T40_001934 [Parthenolecanium corni]|uniref:Uncharacterized protein n=1 Tax=Parthenolecanium corni TaxID=536013 RepID=A0AAN9THH7_9HEMI